MSDVKVSVIIPVYNAQRYLVQCLDSVINQTFHDFEVICIDDGSTDASPDILQKYAESNAAFSVIRQENNGGAKARNYGMSIAKGDYILFLDADDFIAPELIEKCYESITANNADVVLFGGRKYDSAAEKILDKREFLRREFIPENPVFSRDDIPNRILQISVSSPWDKMFSRNFLKNNGLEFQDLPNCDDVYFSMSTVVLADRICVVDDDLIFYRVNAKGTVSFQTYKNPLCFLQAFCALYDLLNEKGIYEQIRQSFLHAILSSIKSNLDTIRTDEGRQAILQELFQDDILRMDLFHADKSYYYSASAYDCAAAVSAALTQYKEMCRREQNVIAVNPIPYRGDSVVDVSIIIPVYNAAKYLDETLHSVTNQSLKKIEIICVNDGSTDDSLEFLEKWAADDVRISVYSQENRGQAAARNLAIKQARGKYIYFMDADDKLESSALQILSEKAEAETLDLIYFDGDVFYDADGEENASFLILANSYVRKGNYEGKVYDGASLFASMHLEKEYLVSPCLQFLRTDFIIENQIEFHSGVIHEDNAFSFKAILMASRASYMHKALFHRRIHENSVMTSQTSFKNSYGYFIAFLDMYETYGEVSFGLSSDARAAAVDKVTAILNNARDCYTKMPKEQRGSELGLLRDSRLFQTLVASPAITKVNLGNEKDKNIQVSNELKRVNEVLQRTYREKSEVNAKLLQTYKEKSEVNAKLKQTYQEKFDRGVEIKKLNGEITRLQSALKSIEAHYESTHLGAICDVYNDVSFSWDNYDKRIEKRRWELKTKPKSDDIAEEPIYYDLEMGSFPLPESGKNQRICTDIQSAHLEAFFHRSDEKKLYVTLVGSRTRNGGKDLAPTPTFSRWTWYPYMHGSLLCLEDPMFYTYENCPLGWFWGTREEDYRQACAQFIKKIADALGVDNEDIVLYGSSGGGTAAIGISKYISGCGVVAINPQLDLPAYMDADVFEKTTGLCLTEEDSFGRANLRDIITDNKCNSYLLLFNLRSPHDFKVQMPSLCKPIGLEPKYGLTQKDNIVIWLYDACGAPSPHSSVENQTMFLAVDFLLQQMRNRKGQVEDLNGLYCMLSELWMERYGLMKEKKKLDTDLKQKEKEQKQEKKQLVQLKQTVEELQEEKNQMDTHFLVKLDKKLFKDK